MDPSVLLASSSSSSKLRLQANLRVTTLALNVEMPIEGLISLCHSLNTSYKRGREEKEDKKVASIVRRE